MVSPFCLANVFNQTGLSCYNNTDKDYINHFYIHTTNGMKEVTEYNQCRSNVSNDYQDVLFDGFQAHNNTFNQVLVLCLEVQYRKHR